MQDVVTLELCEPVRVDPDRLVELCVSMGETQVEAMITETMERLAIGIVEIEEAYLRRDLEKTAQGAESLIKIANQIGMTTFARVADDVATCGRNREGVPLAATLYRLRRIADRSLSAVWDMQDLPG